MKKLKQTNLSSIPKFGRYILSWKYHAEDNNKLQHTKQPHVHQQPSIALSLPANSHSPAYAR